MMNTHKNRSSSSRVEEALPYAGGFFNYKGFTLIEVILVIVVLAIAIPSLISAVSFMTARQVNTIGTTIAVDLAQERMEEIMGDRMNPVRGFVWIVNGNYGPEGVGPTAVAGFPNYNRSLNIICVTAADLNNTGVGCDYKRIQVTVSAVGVGTSVPDAVLYSVVTNH
jgi:prepilin-type N-terminal cleavage/methylation domain-containing protein